MSDVLEILGRGLTPSIVRNQIYSDIGVIIEKCFANQPMPMVGMLVKVESIQVATLSFGCQPNNETYAAPLPPRPMPPRLMPPRLSHPFSYASISDTKKKLHFLTGQIFTPSRLVFRSSEPSTGEHCPTHLDDDDVEDVDVIVFRSV